MTLLTFPARESSTLHCAAETKTGILTLISGIQSKTAAKNQQQKQQHHKQQQMISKRRCHDDVRMLIRHKMTAELPMTPPVAPVAGIGVARQVRVSLFTNVINPYLVIFDSNSKYAKPLTCLRLTACHVIDHGDDVSTFHINIGASKLTAACEIDQSQRIVLRAPTSAVKESWVECLQTHSGAARASSSPSLRRTSPALSALPTLVEQDDDVVVIATKQQQAPPPRSDTLGDVTIRNSDVARRNSLNSLVGRLRSFELNHAQRVFAS